MSISWDEMNEAFKDAEFTIRQAQKRTGDMVRIISGNLRSANVSGYYLCRLKKELKNFDMRTGTWKE